MKTLFLSNSLKFSKSEGGAAPPPPQALTCIPRWYCLIMVVQENDKPVSHLFFCKLKCGHNDRFDDWCQPFFEALLCQLTVQ